MELEQFDMPLKQFDILYNTNSKGNKIIWKIQVENKGDFSEIITETGQIDGKLTKHIKKISKGKNIGKKNSTTHFIQAIKEAQSKWNKRKLTTELNTIIKPMLAQNFKDFKHKLSFPVFVQPKLDGYRCVFNPNTNKFYTRNSKEFNNLDYLLKELTHIPKNIILDGELYNHNLKFEELGALRKNKNNNNEQNKNFQYHIYDLIDLSDSTKKFSERFSLLKNLLNNTNYIKIVDTFTVNNENEINDFHNLNLQNNYEGTMIRNNSLYKMNFRSYDLLKLKNFDDDEFKIIGFEEESDSLTNDKMIIFICETKHKKSFKIGSKGTKKERKEFLEKVKNNPENYIGKFLTVQYFGFTDNGIPRFPKTLRSVSHSIRC